MATLLADDTGLTWPDSLRYTGFHYADWQFDSGDIIAVIRTACVPALIMCVGQQLTSDWICFCCEPMEGECGPRLALPCNYANE